MNSELETIRRKWSLPNLRYNSFDIVIRESGAIFSRGATFLFCAAHPALIQR
jgi:hypothetical protein